MSSNCISFITRFINLLPKGKLFTTRDCLVFGSRANVDQILCRMVKQERIIRLARGVFRKYDPDIPLPTLFEIAKTKAQSFGRSIAKHGWQAARELGLTNNDFPKQPVFAITGRSSSFRLWVKKSYSGVERVNTQRKDRSQASEGFRGGIRSRASLSSGGADGGKRRTAYKNMKPTEGLKVYLHGTSRKIMKLANTKIGQTIRALCYMGKNYHQSEKINELSSRWNRLDRELSYESKPWMPAWMSGWFPFALRERGPYWLLKKRVA